MAKGRSDDRINMLTQQQKQLFLLLLRQGMWGKQEELPACFPLHPLDWQAIYAMSIKQTVQGIIYDGICLLPKAYQPPRPIMIHWTIDIDHIERRNRQQHQTIALLRDLFHKEPQIPFQILKGQSIAAFYPHPEHRFCGDIDVYLGNPTQTEKANQRIEQLGITIQRGQDNDAVYFFNGDVLEHHSILIELRQTGIKKDLRQWEMEVFTQGENQPIPIANHLQLSTHLLKHFINEGIGIRQLCDAAVTLNALAQQTDGKELEHLCKAWNIFHWTRLVYSLLVKYLGLPEAVLPFPCNINPDQLMDEVWESGNLGQGDTRYGNRPEGKWKSKWHTWRIVSNKFHLSLRYAPRETWSWLSQLGQKRIKELINHKE